MTDVLRPSRVEFDHVNFGYHPRVPVIEDLSLMAEAGSVVAIVGPTGAGKTTLASLLMRFYDQLGKYSDRRCRYLDGEQAVAALPSGHGASGRVGVRWDDR